MLNEIQGVEQRFLQPCGCDTSPADQRPDHDAKLTAMFFAPVKTVDDLKTDLIWLNDEIYYAREDGHNVDESLQGKAELIERIQEMESVQ